MNLFNAINSLSGSMESMGAMFGAAPASLSGFSGQFPGASEDFGAYLESFMGESQAGNFLSGLKSQGLDPQRFLLDLESQGIDPQAFLENMESGGGAFSNSKDKSGLSLNEVAEKAAALGGLDLKKFMAADENIISDIVTNNKLPLAATDTKASPFSFMKGGDEDIQKLAALLDKAGAALPATFKKQLGQSLVARGQEGASLNSMQTGADLMGAKNGVKLLKDMLGSLKGELPVLNLDKKALPALKELMAESGLDNASINEMMADLVSGDMGLEEVFFTLNKAAGNLEQNGSLVATKEGLSGLGQLFGSLGAAPEVVKAIVGGFPEGTVITGGALKEVIGAADESLLNAPISAADAENLSNALKAMGASPRQLNSLANLLRETKGRMSVNDFASFFDEMGPGEDVSVGGKELDLIKNIMANISRDQELAKTPVFDETLAKLQALGDQELDDDFMKSSPALQALRGGISGQNADSALGGQMGQNGQGGQQHDREAREQYRQAMHAINTGADTAASGAQVSEIAQNYGYGGQESLSRQISQKILYSHNKGIHRLKMKLNPESMGGLDIELKVKNGELTAHIRAESRAAYKALAGEIDSLKSALSEGGVKLGHMTLAFDDQESGRREFADLGLKGGGRGRRREERQENADPAIARGAPEQAAHEGLLSRHV